MLKWRALADGIPNFPLIHNFAVTVGSQCAFHRIMLRVIKKNHQSVEFQVVVNTVPDLSDGGTEVICLRDRFSKPDYFFQQGTPVLLEYLCLFALSDITGNSYCANHFTINIEDRGFDGFHPICPAGVIGGLFLNCSALLCIHHLNISFSITMSKIFGPDIEISFSNNFRYL